METIFCAALKPRAAPIEGAIEQRIWGLRLAPRPPPGEIEQYCLGRMNSVIPELECKCCMLQEYGGMEESTGGGLGVVVVRGTPFLQG